MRPDQAKPRILWEFMPNAKRNQARVAARKKGAITGLELEAVRLVDPFKASIQ